MILSVTDKQKISTKKKLGNDGFNHHRCMCVKIYQIKTTCSLFLYLIRHLNRRGIFLLILGLLIYVVYLKKTQNERIAT